MNLQDLGWFHLEAYEYAMCCGIQTMKFMCLKVFMSLCSKAKVTWNFLNNELTTKTTDYSVSNDKIVE